MTHGENLGTDSDRPWQSLIDMARIRPGVVMGNNRQALADKEDEGRPVGVVTYRQGLHLCVRTVTGKRKHAGSTLMHMGRNAGRALSSRL